MRLTHSTLIALVSGSLCSIASAQLLSWANSSGGFASTPTNWSPAQMPSASSQLQFNLSNTFTVTYTSNAPTSLSHTYKRGTVSLTSTVLHTTGSMIVADLAAETATARVTSGSFTSTGSIIVGNSNTSNGTLDVSGSASTLSTASGADLIVGNNGAATLNILNGGRLDVGDQFIAGSNSSSAVNILVSGILNSRNSRLNVLGTAESRIGAGGDVSLLIEDTAKADFNGNVVVANGPASTSSITVRNPSGSYSELNVAGSLSLGRNSSSVAAGTGSLIVEQGGSVTTSDPINVGNDPEGGTGLLRIDGGNALVFCNGLNIGTAGTLDLRQGLLQVEGNPFTAPSGFILNLSSPAPAFASLRLMFGSSYTGNNTTILGQATGTRGIILVGSGSNFTQTSGFVQVGFGSDSNSTFSCDNGTFNISTTMRVGGSGQGFLTLENAATGIIRDLEVGTAAAGAGDVEIRDSVLTILDDCVIGGVSNGSGGAIAAGDGFLIAHTNGTLNTPANKTLHVTPSGALECLDGTINALGGIVARGPVSFSGVVNAPVVDLVQGFARNTINARIINSQPLALTGNLLAGTTVTNAIDRTQFNVGPHQLDLRDGSVAVLGNTSIAGGSINANTSLEVHSTATLSGFGTIAPDVTIFGTLAPSGTTGLTFNSQVAAADRTFTGTRLHFAGTSSFLGWNIDSTARLHTDPGSIISLSGSSTVGTNSPDGIILGGELDVSGFIDLVDSDTIALGTRTTLRNASLLITCPFSTLGRTGLASHVLRGTGTYYSSLRSSGTISPGLDEADRTGTLSLRNFYNQSLNNQTGELVIDVDGLTAGSFDVLNLMGGGNLNGTLRLRINYSPNNGDTVRFMTVGGGFIFDGAFSNLIAPPGWSVRYLGNAADAVFCPADFNSDGSADFFDYLDFVADFSAADPRADFNSDGVIDFFDYLDFVAAFSASC